MSLPEGATIDYERAGVVITAVLEARKNKQGLFNNEPLMESSWLDLVKEAAKKIGDERLLLNAVFTITPFIFGQRTEAAYQQIAKSVSLGNNLWLFQPEEVVQKARNNQGGVYKAYREFFRPGGFPVNAITGVIFNHHVLMDDYGGDVRNFFKFHGDDAVKIQKALEIRPRAKSSEKEFLRFGSKLSRFFLQIIVEHELYNLKNRDEFGIPIDFHLGQLFIQTLALPIQEDVNAYQVTNNLVLPTIEVLCRENGWKPKDVSYALWIIGSMGCARDKHQLCPIEKLCNRTVSSKRYYKDGVFEPGKPRESGMQPPLFEY